MSAKVLTPQCVKCGSETLQATLLNVSLQTGPVSNEGLFKLYQQFDCFVCDDCNNKYGLLSIIRRIPGTQDVGIFYKEGRDLEVKLFSYS